MLVAAIALAAALVAAAVAWRLGVRAMSRMETRMAAERAQFEALAHEDSLTGLPNKRAFDDRLDTELRRAAREYYPVALVALDLDRFKQINDTWGHAVGDEALVKLAQHIEAELRAGDICGRVGGDEFLLALVRADAHSAERVLGRLRRALDSVTVGPAGERLGFSAGIAEFPRHSAAKEALLRCADSALYWGKANGRGRATIFSPEAGASEQSKEAGEAAVRQRSLLTTLQALAKAVDGKNTYTVGHSERVATYAVALARSLGFAEERLDALRQAALLHDVGKIGIRETILTKHEALNLEEMEEMQRHSELGRAMLAGAGMPELARWVNHLHERFDGDGYPFGLAGREIPVESRILHVADALDQMARPNALRRNRPLREALAELSYCSGSRLDPEIAARAIDLVHSGELKLSGHDPKPVPRRALDRPRTRARSAD
ncbi:MAG TPA: diguanylate cyclase [Thermoleophilaceae bacterium]|nr:diguanylate cyclase [Thermoleophilaceae bacterium]